MNKYASLIQELKNQKEEAITHLKALEVDNNSLEWYNLQLDLLKTELETLEDKLESLKKFPFRLIRAQVFIILSYALELFVSLLIFNSILSITLAGILWGALSIIIGYKSISSKVIKAYQENNLNPLDKQFAKKRNEIRAYEQKKDLVIEKHPDLEAEINNQNALIMAIDSKIALVKGKEDEALNTLESQINYIFTNADILSLVRKKD